MVPTGTQSKNAVLHWRGILSECLGENSKKTRRESVTSVLQKHETVLGMCFGWWSLPGVADRSGFTSAVVFHVPLQKSMFLPYVTERLTRVILLNT